MDDFSAFQRVFGDSPMVRLIDFLLAERGLYDYTISDICKNSGVSWATLHRIFPRLIEMEIVKQTRTIANAKLYRLNETNLIVKELIRTDNKISEYFIEKEMQKQKVEQAV
ncbi:MAG: hypothetical protein ABH950_07450 [Candidatus Altiarchaeota archaeon]